MRDALTASVSAAGNANKKPYRNISRNTSDGRNVDISRNINRNATNQNIYRDAATRRNKDINRNVKKTSTETASGAAGETTFGSLSPLGGAQLPMPRPIGMCLSVRQVAEYRQHLLARSLQHMFESAWRSTCRMSS